MLAQTLAAASAAIVGLLGLLHLVYTFVTPKLDPRDPALIVRMKEVSPVITRETTIWLAWLGFNASHSMSALLFGAIYGYLALRQPDLLFHSHVLGPVGGATLLAYLFLAARYWFRTPLAGIALAAACYAAAFALTYF